MSTVFIGGSRRLSRLSDQVKERIDNIIQNGFRVLVGDASGADKAVQKQLMSAEYQNVVVFCSGDRPRNNLGGWKTHRVGTAKNLRGFQFYAAKDREMAREAEFGLMIWDGKSAGTILNVLRLLRAGKKAVLFNVTEKHSITFRTPYDWRAFISQCGPQLVDDLRARATDDEWTFDQQASVPNTTEVNDPNHSSPPANVEKELRTINAALQSGELGSVIDALGNIARARGMSDVAKEVGVARESLYRSLSSGGNPEFATVLKVMSSVGLRLVVSEANESQRKRK